MSTGVCLGRNYPFKKDLEEKLLNKIERENDKVLP
jgi:hypothetical protein